MKKLVLSLLCGLASITAWSQTNFRSISFDEALKAAKQEKKMVFIDFYTDWCGPCKMMARDVFPQKKVGDYFNAKFVCIKMNAEKEGKELAAKYKVSAYPTFLALNDKGEVQMDMKGALDADAFIAKVEASLNPEMTVEKMAKRYEAGERTPALVNNYAFHFMEQGNEKEGFAIIDDYYASLTDAQRLKAENAFLFTRYTLGLEEPRAAFMVEHKNEFDASVREAIDERIARLYNSEVGRYFSGYMYRENKYDQATVDELKAKIQSLGLDKNGVYTTRFRLIEGRVKNDDAAYWELCKKEYGNLSLSDQELLMMNLPRLINTKDKAMLGDMARFVRAHLNEMSPTAIVMMGRLLGGLESK